MKILIAPEAIEDLEASINYLAERNLTAAKKLSDNIFRIIDLLAEGKLEGPAQTLRDGQTVRSWPVTPLRIYYQRQEEALFVLRIYHQSQRPIIS